MWLWFQEFWYMHGVRVREVDLVRAKMSYKANQEVFCQPKNRQENV